MDDRTMDRMTTTILEAPPRTATVPTQYSRKAVLAIWAAAALPMGALAWIVAPAVAGHGATDRRFAVTLIAALTAGLIWQFVLVLLLVAYEQRTLRWSVVREALWLRAPSDARGRRGGRLWLWLVPFVLGLAALQLLPMGLSGPSTHDFGAFLGSDPGRDLLRGNWALFGLILVMFAFNTLLGEELLFRGLLLPRMRGAFGRFDWIANGLIFGLYHLHQPWSMPTSVLDGMMYAYATRRWRSAWMGIVLHSVETVVFALLVFAVVIS
jgi:membrane protease YdiL (CAAX protease family)